MTQKSGNRFPDKVMRRESAVTSPADLKQGSV
jgi:hypothetical protein